MFLCFFQEKGVTLRYAFPEKEMLKRWCHWLFPSISGEVFSGQITCLSANGFPTRLPGLSIFRAAKYDAQIDKVTRIPS